ncbi:MAG TPA: DUF6044 family protein [Thermoanaerobaculia bacterium]|jgi:hypothetical protein
MSAATFPQAPRRTWLVYTAATLLSFPVFEMLISGTGARVFARDVFDDGAVSRLGALRLDWSAFGPVLWNRHLMSGNAYFGQFNASPLALDNLLSLAATPFLAFAACSALLAFLAGLSMHLFLEQSVRLPRQAALAGGLIYGLAFWHYTFGFSAALLPLALWIADRVEAWPGGRLRRLVPVAVCAAFLLYNFSPQPAVLTAVLGAGYAVVAADTPSERRSRLLTWAGGWVLAFALYAPVLFTLLRLLPDSQRSIRNNLAWIPDAGTALRLWPQYYFEAIAGRPVVAALGARLREASVGTWYVGFLGIGLLALSIGLPRVNRRERAILWLLAAVPLIDLTAMLLVPYQSHFGVLRSFELDRIRLFVPFVMAANVAIALAALGREKTTETQSSRARTLRSAACTAVLVLFLAGLVACARVAGYLLRRSGWPSTAAGRERLAGWVLATLYYGIAMLVGVAFLWRRRRAEGAAEVVSRGAVAALLAVLAFERLASSRIERWIENETLASFDEALGETPAIRFLQTQPNAGSQRVLLLGDTTRANPGSHPNRLMSQGLFSADGYQLVYPLRYHDLFGLLTKPHLDKDPDRRRYFENWGQRAYAFGPELNRDLASLMGIRWLLVRGLPFADEHWRLVFEKGDERVFENPDVLPRGFVATRERRYPSHAELFAALGSAPLEELRRTAFVEGDGPAAGPTAASAGSATATVDTPDRLAFTVEAAGPAVLVLTDAFTPGWKAWVNGVPRPIFPVDGAFRGIAVSGGKSDVSFRFVPESTRAGFVVAAAAFVALVLLSFSSRGLPRRGARPPVHAPAGGR